MTALAYKANQGYWTRLGSALGAAALVAFGAMWLWGQLGAVDVDFPPIYLQFGVAGPVMLVGGLIIYWLTYIRPKSVEFLIAVEGEMHKVNWSSRREVFGSTWVVIAISVIIAAVLFFVDIGFSRFFRAIDVLKTG